MELNVEDLGLDYDIVEDDSEKKSDVPVSTYEPVRLGVPLYSVWKEDTSEPVKVDAPVFTLSVEDTNLDYDIAKENESDADVKSGDIGRGLTSPIMIFADTEEEKEFRKQHNPVEDNQPEEPTKGYTMISSLKSSPKEETIDIDELEKLVAGPLK